MPVVVSDVNVTEGAAAVPETARNIAVMPAWLSLVRQSDKPDAMSVRFWLTAADRIVVFGTNVFIILNDPDPLYGVVTSYGILDFYSGLLSAFLLRLLRRIAALKQGIDKHPSSSSRVCFSICSKQATYGLLSRNLAC